MGTTQSVSGFRVTEVQPGSPLKAAGLQVYLDFILTANGLRLQENGTFAMLIAHSAGRRLPLQVFNLWTGTIRDVTVVPQEDWGGSGLLGGCVRFETWSPQDLGIRVLQVVSDSEAQRSGLQAGDFILGTDSVPFKSIDQLCALLHSEVSLHVFNPQTGDVRRVHLHPCDSLGIEAERTIAPH